MSEPIDRHLIEKVVREALAELVFHDKEQAAAKATASAQKAVESQKPAEVAQGRAEPLPPPFDGQLKSLKKPRVLDPADAERTRTATPARLVQGRTGTRYLTGAYIGLRAEHAIALDAVHSEVPEEFVAQLGCISLKTKAKDRQEYLLYPEQGRRLDAESVKKLQAEGTRGADVQVIVSDGLAAWAILENGVALLQSLEAALGAVGLSFGKPVFVRMARIGVQDEIGTLLGSRSTLIAVGERPGLGTGDSLSIYTAFGPKLGQDNAEKDCISNIRQLGIPPEEAAREAATLLRRSFDAGGGGVALTRKSGQ